MKKLISLLLINLIWISACQHSDKEKNDLSSNPSTPDPVVQVELTQLTKQVIADVIECTGIVNVPPNMRAEVHAPIGGIVSNIRVLEGDYVKKNQVLFTLTHQEIVRLQEDFLKAKSTYELASIGLEQKEKLVKSESISQREIRIARAEYNEAQATYKSLERQLKLIGIATNNLTAENISSSINVSAPISGYVTEINAFKGTYVDINSDILTLVNTEHRHLELDIYADKIGLVEVGQKVGFKLAGSDIEHWAKVVLVGKEVDEHTRTVNVHADIEDEHYNDIIIGNNIYAGILIKPDSVYCLPSSSFVSIEGLDFVLVKKDGKLEPVEVVKGRNFKGFIEVVNHVDLQGQKIVKEDAYYLIEN